jgi:hypothetical protein
MLLLGTTIVGIGAAIVTYCISFGALSWRRRQRSVPPPAPAAQVGLPKTQEPAA